MVDCPEAGGGASCAFDRKMKKKASEMIGCVFTAFFTIYTNGLDSPASFPAKDGSDSLNTSLRFLWLIRSTGICLELPSKCPASTQMAQPEAASGRLATRVEM